MDQIGDTFIHRQIQNETQFYQETSAQWDLDEALKDLKFGSYQIRNLFLIGLLALFSGMFPLSFTLTAGDLDYRCLVPECENASSSNLQYVTPWIKKAVPFKNDKPWKCRRFKPQSRAAYSGNNECSTSFNTHEEEDCNSFVYATDEVTIVKEFGIFCEYKKWMLSLLGTINNIGQFIGISLFGMISDRFGRKVVLIFCTMTSAICAICRGLSTNYFIFASLEFLGAFFASAIFLTSSTLAIELVNPKMRPLAVSIINIFFPIGTMIMGALAWYFRNWRKLLIVSHFPALLSIFYFWLIPESVRWLHTKGYTAEVNTILRNISGSNNMELSEKPSQKENSNKHHSPDQYDKKKQVPVTLALKKKHILFRLIRCTFLWITCTLIYYGLSINSTELIGNKYLNFILTCGIDIPAIIISGFVLKKINRRESQSISFFLSGIGCIISELIPADMMILKMTFYLTSKFAITAAFTIIYIYTAEMFPTEVRQTLSATASTIGRTGSMIAPHTILLKDYFGDFGTAALFGIVGILAGFLSMTFPETLNKKLPDTIDQAKFKDDQ